MTFWQWFQVNGAKIFAFIAAASVSLQSVDGLPPGVSKGILIAGMLATLAHQIFFPNVQGPTAPKA